MTRGPRRRSLRWLAAVGLVAAACQTPTLESGPTPTSEPTLLGASPFDPLAPAVVATVDELLAHVEEVLDDLDVASGATLERLHVAASAAARALTADDSFGGAGDAHPRPLLPGPGTSREEVVDWNDLLSDALTAGREVGGDRLLGVLSDPIAGDLGAWQRDPAGVYDGVHDVLDEATGDLDAATTSIATLDGQALRALAWLEVGRSSSAATTAAEALRRASAHLEIVREALAGLAADLATTDPS